MESSREGLAGKHKEKYKIRKETFTMETRKLFEKISGEKEVKEKKENGNRLFLPTKNEDCQDCLDNLVNFSPKFPHDISN